MIATGPSTGCGTAGRSIAGHVALATTLALCACRPVYHVYWGDVHGHSALSDGKGTPDEYFSFARDRADLDFAILTDHDFDGGPPWRLSAEQWHLAQDAARRATTPGEFVGIAGYEWTSQPKYWKDNQDVTEGLFDGPVREFNHKIVCFPHEIDDIYRSKDAAYRTPDLLADAVARAGGLVHNAHPTPDDPDQWHYTAAHAAIIANTEIGPDRLRYDQRDYETRTEQAVVEYLCGGGRTGFVAGSDTHEGHPSAHTAVLARALTADDLFDALRSRRTYAVTHARIGLDFRINGHRMGEQFETGTPPRLSIRVRGTAPLSEVVVFRDGDPLVEFYPEGTDADLNYTDEAGGPTNFYYVRVTQADTDEQGNPSRAWSSPIWVTRRRAGS